MTTGADTLSLHRRVRTLSGPIVLTNLTTPIVGLTDTAVMGHLDSPHYLGAVSVGAMIFTFIAWSCGFLRMGTTALTAQAHGAGQPTEERAVLARGLAVALALGCGLLALNALIAPVALDLMRPSPDVIDQATLYLQIRGWGFPATLANYAVLGWLIGQARPGAAMVQQITIYAVNVALDLAFVPGLGMTADGVALATVIAEHAGLAVGLGLVAQQLRRRGGRWDRARVTQLAALRRLFAINRDLFIRTLTVQATFVWFTVQSARFGDTVLAANAVLKQFIVMGAYVLDAFAFAAEVLVGENVGAGNRRGVIAAARVCAVWSGGAALLLSLVYWAAGGPIITALTDLPAVRATAAAFLPWVAPIPLVAVWGYLLDGIFIGATWTRSLVGAMLASLAAFALAMVTLVPWLGNHGLWLALYVVFAARGISLWLLLPHRLAALR